MNYNANVDGWLVVKGDRIVRTLEDLKAIAREENTTLTTEELVTLISAIQKLVARETTQKTSAQ